MKCFKIIITLGLLGLINCSAVFIKELYTPIGYHKNETVKLKGTIEPQRTLNDMVPFYYKDYTGAPYTLVLEFEADTIPQLELSLYNIILTMTDDNEPVVLLNTPVHDSIKMTVDSKRAKCSFRIGLPETLVFEEDSILIFKIDYAFSRDNEALIAELKFRSHKSHKKNNSCLMMLNAT